MSTSPDSSAFAKRKRNRVPISCTYCRVKKIKCDRKQPCHNCVQKGESCLYPPRRENPKMDRQAMQDRIERLENLVKRMVNPDAGLSNELGQVPTQANPMQEAQDVDEEPASDEEGDESGMAFIDRLLEAAEADDEGTWSYQGNNSGLSFIRNMQEHVGTIVSDDAPKDMTTWAAPLREALNTALEENRRFEKLVLPPLAEAEELVSLAIDEGCALYIFIHRPTFDQMVQRIYNKSPKSYDRQDLAFLPQLYAALALGSACKGYPIGSVEKTQALKDGAKYFVAAKRMLDIPNCRNFLSLQAVILLSLFCLHHVQMAECYSYCSNALSCALQMGMHRDIPTNTNIIESESRKRAFWVIRKLELYLCGILGLPKLLSEDDVDQALPSDSGDEYITKACIFPMLDGQASRIGIGNAHTRLLNIFPKILNLTSRVKADHRLPTGHAQSLGISENALRRVERELQEWSDKLPQHLRPGYNIHQDNLEKLRYYLRICYSYYQMILYRPFIKYISPSLINTADRRCVACAAACIRVSRGIIATVRTMNKSGLLQFEEALPAAASYFAINALSFYVLQNEGVSCAGEMIADTKTGFSLLTNMSRHSMWAERCCKSLKPLMDKLSKIPNVGNPSTQNLITPCELPGSSNKLEMSGNVQNPASSWSLNSGADIDQFGRNDHQMTLKNETTTKTSQIPNLASTSNEIDLDSLLNDNDKNLYPSFDLQGLNNGIQSTNFSQNQMTQPQPITNDMEILVTEPLDYPMAPLASVGIPEGYSSDLMAGLTTNQNEAIDTFHNVSPPDYSSDPIFSFGTDFGGFGNVLDWNGPVDNTLTGMDHFNGNYDFPNQHL